MNSANEKTNEIKKLAGIEKLRFDIEKRLIKLSKSTKNDPFQMSSNLDAIDRSTGAPLRDVYEMALQAERATTVKSFLPKRKWPDWLNFAVGYGADGMVGGDDNIFESNGITYDYSHINRNRQFYLSPDIDLSKIKTNKKLLRSILIVFNQIQY